MKPRTLANTPAQTNIHTHFEDYIHYLKSEGLAPETVYQHRRYAGHFVLWIQENSLTLEEITSRDILDYVDHLRGQDFSIGYINRVMLAVRYYFSWHLKQNTYVTTNPATGPKINQSHHKINYNPATGIILKGGRRTSIPKDLLTKAELEELYESYMVKDARTHRNKVILSLFIYQGLATGELQMLKPGHIKLSEGKIEVPETNGAAGRTLDLVPSQIMLMHKYVTAIRPQIIRERTAERPGRKPDATTPLKKASEVTQLFISMSGSEDLADSIHHLNRWLKKLHPKYRNAQQIRQSVITEWLKEKDVRIVQYMAGHRHVGSTERYQTNNLEELKTAVGLHHPLK